MNARTGTVEEADHNDYTTDQLAALDLFDLLDVCNHSVNGDTRTKAFCDFARRMVEAGVSLDDLDL